VCTERPLIKNNLKHRDRGYNTHGFSHDVGILIPRVRAPLFHAKSTDLISHPTTFDARNTKQSLSHIANLGCLAVMIFFFFFFFFFFIVYCPQRVLPDMIR